MTSTLPAPSALPVPSAGRTRPGAPSPRRGADVVFLGRLEAAACGLDLLVDAWARVSHRVPGRLVLAGRGPDGDALRRRAECHGVDSRVHVAGGLPEAGRTALAASARVVVVPAHGTGDGAEPVRALPAGTAVVTYTGSCVGEVGPAGRGVLVPLTGEHVRDVASYTAVLLAALRTAARRDGTASAAAVPPGVSRVGRRPRTRIGLAR